jgi:DNA gyrase subunit B
MEVALQYNDGYSEIFQLRQQHQHGGWRHAPERLPHRAHPHHQRVRPASGLFKDVKENLTGDDVREGLTAVVSVKVPQPQFEGQTKGKLNSDISGYMTQFVNEKLGEYFDKNPPWPQDRRQGD